MAKVCVAVGSLPVGVEDVQPSIDGSAPYVIATPRSSLSVVLPLIAFVDTEGFERQTDLVIPSVDTRVRFSLDNVTWGLWSEGITIPSPLTASGTQFYMQTRGFASDLVDLAVDLVVNQEGLVQVSTLNLPSAIEPVSASDSALMNLIGLLSGSEALDGSDYSAMAFGGSVVALPSVTDGVTNSDVATINFYGLFGDVVDTTVEVDSGSLGTVISIGDQTDGVSEVDSSSLNRLLVAPALSSMTAGEEEFTVTVGTVTGATNYDLRYKLSSGSTWTEVHNVGSGTETVTGLTGGSQYDVQARTVNGDGDGAWGATTNVTPTSPASSFWEETFANLTAWTQSGDAGYHIDSGALHILQENTYGETTLSLNSATSGPTEPIEIDFYDLTISASDILNFHVRNSSGTNLASFVFTGTSVALGSGSGTWPGGTKTMTLRINADGTTVAKIDGSNWITTNTPTITVPSGYKFAIYTNGSDTTADATLGGIRIREV